ncbi:hypothetical protein CBOM_08132 [Ceraceosorus bombacis]|uniref:Uncharacterized protein n=1 Tax=Ceraceosorus bombacis TaxID=401625 RepID=A0A0P1B8V2_9BASI|nr:hypothetical protein CBOM_08132 [Ceraceosorus bombacis]
MMIAEPDCALSDARRAPTNHSGLIMTGSSSALARSLQKGPAALEAWRWLASHLSCEMCLPQ